LLVGFVFLVPCISMLPPGPEEVNRWGVISGSVQVELTVAEWLQLLWRHRADLRP